MSESKGSKIVESIASMVTAENIQKYVLGTNKAGQPRALYDVAKDIFGGKKKKKKKKNKGGNNSLDIFVSSKKKKKNKKKSKHWHI